MKILKRIKFLSSKRALLENEMVLTKFYNFAIKKYTKDELKEYMTFLENVYDTDLLDVIIGKKEPQQFIGKYNVKFLADIRKFVKKIDE